MVETREGTAAVKNWKTKVRTVTYIDIIVEIHFRKVKFYRKAKRNKTMYETYWFLILASDVISETSLNFDFTGKPWPAIGNYLFFSRTILTLRCCLGALHNSSSAHIP